MKNALILLLLVAGIAGANDANDLRDFAGLWLTDYNFVDYATFANSWNGSLVGAICANDINVATVTYELREIQLEVSGASYPPYNYVIESEPNSGQLYDIDFTANSRGSLQPNRFNLPVGFRPVSGPQTLMRKNDKVYFYGTDTNSTSFTYSINNHTGESNIATVNISGITEHTKDAVSFSGGQVVIDDNDAVEFDGGFTFTAWLRCSEDYCNILQKKQTSGAGVKLGIRAGHLRFEVWDSNDNYGYIIGRDSLSKEDWFFIAVAGDTNSVQMYVNGYPAADTNDIPAGPYSNDANLIIADGFTGDIDRFSFWGYKSDLDIAFISMELRTGPGGGFMVPTDYFCRFDCNETTGSTITDSKLGLVGNITGSFSWLPDGLPRRKQKIQFFRLGD